MLSKSNQKQALKLVRCFQNGKVVDDNIFLPTCVFPDMEEVEEEMSDLDFEGNISLVTNTINTSLAIQCGLGITNTSVAIVQVNMRASYILSHCSNEKTISTERKA